MTISAWIHITNQLSPNHLLSKSVSFPGLLWELFHFTSCKHQSVYLTLMSFKIKREKHLAEYFYWDFFFLFWLIGKTLRLNLFSSIFILWIGTKCTMCSGNCQGLTSFYNLDQEVKGSSLLWVDLWNSY